MQGTGGDHWLLIFYSVPSKPVGSRMKIWRKLSKAGAVQLKGAVYILPASDEHEELFQWIIGEIKTMGGDGAFAKSDEIRTMTDIDIRNLFTAQAAREYRRFEKKLDIVERKVQSIRKGAKNDSSKPLKDQAGKLMKEFDDILRRDFFTAPEGQSLKKRMQALEGALLDAGRKAPATTASIAARRPQEFQGKTWATRKHPFVDRMASAWLIKRFVDPHASFRFVEERSAASDNDAQVTFDMRDGAFTHVADLCTFEVLVKSFEIKDKAVRKIAEIVHDLDMKDDKFGAAEAAGVEDILSGIRKTAQDDFDALERGMAAFEMLYQSKS